MPVSTLRLGPYQTNCYILQERQNAWIIDPGFDGHLIAKQIMDQNLTPKAVVLTHSHWDHVLGIPGLIEAFGTLPVMIHKDEAQFLGADGGRTLRAFALSIDPGMAKIPRSVWESLPEPTRLLSDGDLIEACSLAVLHTPGHSPGSISLYQESTHTLFSGDTLFAQSIGRTDLPNSLPEAIIGAIRTRLLTLPEQTIVYPGHGPTTTIGAERENPWLR